MSGEPSPSASPSAPTAKRSALLRLLRFGAVGGAATLIYFAAAMAARWVGAGLLTAHATAFAVSTLASFLGHKLITFQVKGETARTGARFGLATAAIALAQGGLVHLLGAAGAGDLLIFLASSLFYPAASFLTHWLWTFRRPG